MFRPYYDLWDFFTDTPVIYSLILTLAAGVAVPYIVAYFIRLHRERKLAEQRKIDSSVGQFNTELISAINYHRKNIAKPRSDSVSTDSDEKALLDEVEELDEPENRRKAMEAHKKFVNFNIDDDKDLSKLSVNPSSINSSSTSLINDKENDGQLSAAEEEVLINGALDANMPAEDTGDVLNKLTNMELHGKLATAQLKVRTKKLVDAMSEEEREQERKIREDQLNAIFALMKEQEDKFGIHAKGELEDQLKMYNL